MRNRLTLALLAVLLVMLVVNFVQALDFGEDAAVVEIVEKHRTVAAQSGEASSDGERMIDRTFAVSPGGNLEVDLSHADLEVEVGGDAEAHIEVFLSARDWDRAKEYFEQIQFTIEERGGDVLVRAEQPRWNNWSSDRTGHARILVRATVPSRFDADLATSHGDVDLASIEGRVLVATSHGDVQTEALRGPEIEIRTSHGDVEAGRLQAEVVAVRTSHGDIDVEGVDAARIEMQSSHGDIELEDVLGQTEATTSHGDIRLSLAKAADFRLRTSHGDIHLSAPADLPADLDLRAEQVRVSSDYRFEGTIKKTSAEGRLNGGGPRLEAHVSHGSVVLSSVE